MPAAKAQSTIIAAGTSNAAGATTNGTAVDLSTAYGALITIKLTNGGTAPAVAPYADIQVSGDVGGTWKSFYKVGGDTVPSSVNEFAIEVPAPAMRTRVVVGGNTVQPVTCEAFAQVLTGI